MAKRNEPEIVDNELDIEQLKRRMDMLDQRLDNVDTIITAAVERVMQQPITLDITCPHCGKNIEIALIGSKRPGR